MLKLLSPTNKEPPGPTEYLLKRNAVLHQPVHLVELDLPRGGRRPPQSKPWPAGDCAYLLSRFEDRPDSQVYSWTLRQPLPTLPVPLRSPDADVMIDLAAVFNEAFDRGRFGKKPAYTADPKGFCGADAVGSRSAHRDAGKMDLRSL